MNNTPIKVVVAHSSSLLRAGIVTLLRRLHDVHIHPLEVTSYKSLLNICAIQPIHYVIVDPTFPNFDLKEFNYLHAGIPCIAYLTSLMPVEQFQSYTKAVTIYDEEEQFEHLFLHLEREKGKEQFSELTVNEPQELLSSREREIVVGVVKGYTNKEIADELCLSIHTVITHRRNISKKLEIHSPAGLTVYAIVNKLVDIKELK